MGDNYIEFTMPYPRRFKRVYQLHIRLKEIKPSVWRRIQVPENYTFYDLHVAIQDAMGWEDYHYNEELSRWLGDWQPDNFDPKQVKFERPRERVKKALES